MMALVILYMSVMGGPCESVKDHDLRHYCRAQHTGNSAWCAAVKEHDTREMCYTAASWRKNRYYLNCN